MAAEILRHQSSMAYCDNNHSGGVWGLFQFLDLHKHLHKRKMLSYTSHGDKKHGKGSKIMTSAQNAISSDQEQLLDKGVNYQMENKHRLKKKSSGKAHFLTLLYKKMTKKKDRKLKISSSASQLPRTVSIHHLECNDYVLSDSIASDSDSSTCEDYSARSERTSLSRQGSEGTLDEKRLEDVIKENKKEHQISMDGVLDKIPIDHKLSDNVDGEKRSKFGSEGFVYINSKLAQRSIQRSRSLTETSTVRDPQILPRRSNSFKEGGNNISNRRILPSPSLSDSLDRYSRLFESMSARDLQRSNSTKEHDNNHAHRRTLRSHTHTESFDIYSCLLESLLVREPQRLPRRSNSVREKDSSFTQQTTLRSCSLIDSFDVFSHLLESVSVREHKTQPEILKSISEEDSFSSNRGLESDSLCNYVPSSMPNLPSNKQKAGLLAGDVEVDSNRSDEQNSVSALANTEEIMGTEMLEHHHNEECTSNATMGALNQPELISVDYQTEECIISDEEDASDVKEDPSEKPAQPMPVAILDSHFEADPISPAKYAVKQDISCPSLADTELHSSWITFEEQDNGANSENKKVEFIEAADIGNALSSYVEVEAEFNYVKVVLKKSGFDRGAEEFLAAWYSSYEPIDQLLYVGELDTVGDDFSEIPPDRQLLLDLINEILLDIYESIIACSIGLSSFSPRIRPMPVGDQVLEEVWAKVKWLLNSQRRTNTTLEQLEARDFGKSDGWMNLLLDVERVGTEFEGLILEDLIEEIIVDFLVV